MKIIATRAMRLGRRKLEEGDEIDLPDRFARHFLHAGYGREAETGPADADGKPAKPAAPARKYRTRQVKAED
jgi:hypothetical protein